MHTILLVNDSATLTKVLTGHFERADYNVIAVADVVEAYKAIIRNDVDLILTDYIVGPSEGTEILEAKLIFTLLSADAQLH